MKRLLIAGVIALALTGCATIPAGADPDPLTAGANAERACATGQLLLSVAVDAGVLSPAAAAEAVAISCAALRARAAAKLAAAGGG
jgi:hypothetical protein